MADMDKIKDLFSKVMDAAKGGMTDGDAAKVSENIEEVEKIIEAAKAA